MKVLIKKQGLLFCLLLTAGILKAQDYVYDSNGNLIQDNNKGHQSISYNHLNLVEKVTFKAGGAIAYSYDAAGNKLSKTVTDPQGKSTTWYYAGGFEYSNDKQLEFFATEEGRVTRQGEIYNYEYNLKDHLGNTRVSFDKDPTTGKARIIQKDAYYPFGGIQPGNSFASGQQNKYLYNGKELQEELGLYDYGARMYDPMLARWNGVDPLAEKYSSWSPYNYVLNNPLKYVDPKGESPTLATAGIGVAVGGLVGGLVEVGTQFYHQGEVTNWKAVLGATARGAIIGGAIGFAGPAGYATVATVGASANVIGGVIDKNVIQGLPVGEMQFPEDGIAGAAETVGGKALGEGAAIIADKFINKAAAKVVTKGPVPAKITIEEVLERSQIKLDDMEPEELPVLLNVIAANHPELGMNKATLAELVMRYYQKARIATAKGSIYTPEEVPFNKIKDIHLKVETSDTPGEITYDISKYKN